MKVCLVVGSPDVRFCGVKDYALRLAEALREAGIEAEVRAPKTWGLSAVAGFRRQLQADSFDVVHVQYPAIGFRYSLAPMLLGALGVARCVCATLHEYAAMPFAQRMAMQAFRATARGLVFTTVAELRRFGSAKGRVIGIGSNVAAPACAGERGDAIVSFGQVRPEKGLEAFLEAAAGEPAFRFQVLGAAVAKHRDYLERLQAGSPANVEWLLDEELDRVAERMSRARAAYLPFPDGATLKRGSLLAALACGLPVVTTISAETPDELAAMVLRADSAREAGDLLRRLAESSSFASDAGERGRRFAEGFSWAAIAAAHLRFYEELLSGGEGRQIAAG